MYFQINKPAAFTVNFNGAQGKLDARVVAPSGAEDEAIIQEVDKGIRSLCKQYRLQFDGLLRG